MIPSGRPVEVAPISSPRDSTKTKTSDWRTAANQPASTPSSYFTFCFCLFFFSTKRPSRSDRPQLLACNSKLGSDRCVVPVFGDHAMIMSIHLSGDPFRFRLWTILCTGLYGVDALSFGSQTPSCIETSNESSTGHRVQMIFFIGL